MARTKQPPAPKEEQEQAWLMEWAAWATPREPLLDLLYHVPNGGARPASVRTRADGRTVRYSVEAAKLKAQGVKTGVPDLFLPVPRRGYHGLYIELKRLRGGKLEEEQKAWIVRLTRQGYCVKVCRGWVRAAGVICAYLERPDLRPV